MDLGAHNMDAEAGLRKSPLVKSTPSRGHAGDRAAPNAGRLRPGTNRINQSWTASGGVSIIPRFLKGAIAQLGERNTGSVEVGGSIPPGSTNFLRNPAGPATADRPVFLYRSSVPIV